MKYFTFGAEQRLRNHPLPFSKYSERADFEYEFSLIKEINEPDTEIALSELFCIPKCWPNHSRINRKVGEVLWLYQRKPSPPVISRGHMAIVNIPIPTVYHLPPDNYVHFTDVVKKISEDSPHTGVDVILHEEGDDVEVHFFLHPKPAQGEIELQPFFNLLFNVTSDEIEREGVRHIVAREGEWVKREKPGRLMFVYCDVVEPRPVGDSESRLLRVIPMCKREDVWIEKIFKKRFYFKLQSPRLKKVRFSFRDEFGNRIYLRKFQLTLHIRHHD